MAHKRTGKWVLVGCSFRGVGLVEQALVGVILARGCILSTTEVDLVFPARLHGKFWCFSAAKVPLLGRTARMRFGTARCSRPDLMAPRRPVLARLRGRPPAARDGGFRVFAKYVRASG